MIGQTVGHYRIVRKLGAGGMGEVYLAEDTELDRQVALKFLPPHVASDGDVLARFKREAKAAAALDHPNIITVHEIGEHEGRAYIVMAYVRGESLSDVIARKELTVDRALQITMQIADGLAKAHGAGIVHRDIKPDNVAIDGDGHVRILDFGLAKLGGASKLTREHSTVGTLHYMSPEQSRGEEVDQRTDLFSLGAILYEMIAGRRAFDGDHSAAVQYSIANEDPQPMSRFNNQATPEVERMVAKLIAKEAASRYQSAADLMADIRRVRADSDRSAALPAARPASRRLLIGLGVTAVVAAAAVWIVVSNPFGSRVPQVAASRPMIVVLPFENLGIAEDEYFADGITEEITSRLATITGLGVISRTSAMRYKDTDKSLPEIAGELGVHYVLEGTIRWDKSQSPEVVRITPQLIRVSDDTHLWANNYERELKRIFEVQADIATHIAAAMEITLLERDRQTIENIPTESTDAYTYFLRGLESIRDENAFSTGRVETAIDMFTRAVEIDSEFAAAWAGLSTVYASYYHNGMDRTPDRLAMAKTAAERALAIDPDLADARLAMALYYYWGHKDYHNAVRWTEQAAAVRPGDANIIQMFGWILRRLGRFEDALARLEEALTLDPQDRSVIFGIAECYWMLGRVSDARPYIERAVAMNPDDPFGYWYLAFNARLSGDMDQARGALESYSGNNREVMASVRYEYYFHAREFDKAIAALETAPEIFVIESSVFPKTLGLALAHLAAGDTATARVDFTAAKQTMGKLIAERPDDHRLYSAIGMAQAGLGEAEEAIANGRRSVEMYPMSKDRYGGVWRIEELAHIYAIAGYVGEAIEQLDYLLSIDCYINLNWIELNPNLDNIRSDPRYQELLRKYGPTT